MARPATIRDEDIITAAQEVFLERGAQATTAEVAARAGVSEGTLFNRFKSKVDLFRAAMEPPAGKVPEWLQFLGDRVGLGSVRNNLEDAAIMALAFFRKIMPLIMMSWSNQSACGLPEALMDPDPAPLRALKHLAGYFEAEMRLGRLRRHDAEILARTFTGCLMQYVVFETIMKAHDQLPLPEERFARGLVELIWQGAAPAKADKR